jgi:ornithine cyclodeaminase/alanine dehydrogenase-like protein (mu-crystallin family)
MNGTDLHHLKHEDLEALGITTTDVIDAIERATLAKTAGTLWDAPKASIMPGDGRYMMATLAVSGDPALTVVKTVMVSPDNGKRGLPSINGSILIMDAVTGLLRAVLDANWVTAVRTAGLSAVMAKRLANPASKSIALIGSGVQALSHTAAFCDLFSIQEVRIVGRGRPNIEKFLNFAQERGLRATEAKDATEAMEGADLIVSSITLDYGVEPFLDARRLKPGAFATVTDLGIPWIPEGNSTFGQLYVDDKKQEEAMPKPLVDPSLIQGDLNSVVTGKTPAAYDPERPSAFFFRGLALGDLAVAILAYQRSINN